MKKLFLSSLVSMAIVACSNTTPPTQKLSQDLTTIPSGTAISVNADEQLKAPKDTQAIIKLSHFVVADNVYSPDGERLLVPRGAVLSGLYTNSGVDCSIAWKSIAYDKNNLADKKVSLDIANLTDASTCDSVQGINRGDRIVVRFK